jgi:hypothetical protein
MQKNIFLATINRQFATVAHANAFHKSEINYLCKTKLNKFFLISSHTPKKRLWDFFDRNQQESEFIILTHGKVDKSDKHIIDAGGDNTTIIDLVAKLPKNATVHITCCYQPNDHYYLTLSQQYPDLAIIAFGDVDKTTVTDRIDVNDIEKMDLELYIEKYSYPLNQIRVFKNGQKIREITTEDYFQEESPEIAGYKIKIDPIIFGRAIFKKCPDRIQWYFAKYSNCFLPQDIEKINQLIITKPENYLDILKEFFQNTCLVNRLKKYLSITEPNEDEKKDIELLIQLLTKRTENKLLKKEDIKDFASISYFPKPKTYISQADQQILSCKENSK